MLQVNFIRDNRERVLQGLKTRAIPEKDWGIVDEIIALDDRRKATQTERDSTLAERNRLSKEIGQLFQSGRREEAERMKSQVADLKDTVSELETDLTQTTERLEALLLTLPNVPHPSVPAGNSEADNEVYQAWDHPLPQMGEAALPHWDLGQKYNIIDFDLGVKLTGSGFPVFRGKGARLERALISFSWTKRPAPDTKRSCRR